MEKHKCKLCFRSFSNGKALGGHMRSHMMNLPIPPPKQNNSPSPSLPPPMIQLSFEAESGSSPSSSSFYGLRENPKRSFRFTDPNQIIDAGSIILQEDGGSESESSKNPTGRRSKRFKKIDPVKNSIQTPNESVLSSSSDITTEEDIAFCLMMLSRHNNNNNNNWKTKQQNHHHYHQYQEDQQEEEEEQFNQYLEEDEDEDVEEEEESEAESEEEEEEELKPLKKVRGRYKCDTCNKVFRSYQALGGHRASHKKNMKLVAENGGDSISNHHDHRNKIENNVVVNHNNNGEKRIHECPICFREFSSGQALGGHKRTHGIGIGSSAQAPAAATTTTVTAVTTTTNVPTINVEVVPRSSANIGESLIDLNLPADMDEDEDGDDVSQIEGSAVSDAEIVKP
ncbi:zinc finger protein ZAT9 [Trifolium repens]|nr:zinc finger protein ZAT9 [Trifolium repens]